MYQVRDRLKYIGKRVSQVRGEYLLYQRGQSSVPLLIAPGHTDVQDLTPQTSVTQIRYVDFIINRKELILPGYGLTLPQRGDSVIWNGDTYILTPPTDVDDVYTPTTMYRDRLRIHTVLTTEALLPK